MDNNKIVSYELPGNNNGYNNIKNTHLYMLINI